MAPTTPTGPAPTTPTAPAPTTPTEPTTPFTLPPGPLVQNTPDSGYGNDDDDDVDSTTTLGSVNYEGLSENGFSYHSYDAGRYFFPNGITEQERLDLQNEAYNLTFNRERIDSACTGNPIPVLHLSPLTKNAPWIIDIGTGTGIWAINVGERYPAAQVIGIDLSPIQPRWVPPNVKFLLDNIEAERPWLYSGRWDLIHARMMFGALEDWPRFLRKCFESARLEGWIEALGPHLPFDCDDNSLPPEEYINR